MVFGFLFSVFSKKQKTKDERLGTRDVTKFEISIFTIQKTENRKLKTGI